MGDIHESWTLLPCKVTQALVEEKDGREIKAVVQNIDFGCLFSTNNKISSFFRFANELDKGTL
jgi:hypothetical protein